jgi:hypothetical protein
MGNVDKGKIGPAGREYLRRFNQAEVPERDTATAGGRALSYDDALGLASRYLGGLPHAEIDRAKAATLEELDPAKIEKDRKYDMYSALTNFGLNIMSPDTYQGEGLLGSIAKAAKATLPQYEASRKERKAAKSAAIRDLMAYEEIDRKTAIQAVELATDVYKTGLSADQANRALAFDREKLNTQVSEGKLDRDVQRLAVLARQNNPTTFETQLAAYRKSYPGVGDVALFKQMKTDGLLGAAQSGGIPPFGGGEETGGAAGPQPVLLGSRPVQ